MLDKLRKARESKTSSLWAGKLYKGSRKPGKNAVGKDLGQLFRFEPFSSAARSAMLKVEGAKEDDNGDVLLLYLDIFAASEEINKTFNAECRLWDATGLVFVCDGTSIASKRESYTDEFGHQRTRMIPCGDPCPIADEPLGAQCPLKGKQEAELLFYVPQLIAEGIALPVQMTLHAWSDLFSVSECLDTIHATYGAIKSSPFPCGSFGNIIPLVLRRNLAKIKRPVIENDKRTGKKADGKAWAIAISVNPVWHHAYVRWQQSIAVRGQLGGSSAEAARLYLEAVTLESPPIPSLPPATRTEKPALTPSEPDRPDDWKEAAIDAAIGRGLKPETARILAGQVKTPEGFNAAVDRCLAIQRAIDNGIDPDTAKAMMRECNNDVVEFSDRVEAILDEIRSAPVDVEVAGEESDR